MGALRRRTGASLMVLSERGVVFAAAIDATDDTRPVPALGGWVYLRAQLVDAQGRILALTNPVWR